MSALDILEQWVEPLTGPLGDFLKETQTLATIHQNSVQSFNNLAQDLTDTNAADAFAGDGASNFVELTGEYLTSEVALSGTTAALAGPLADAGAACATAVVGIGDGVATAVAAGPEVDGLLTVTAVIDVTTAAQGGLDVPEDVVAVAATSISIWVVVGIIVALVAVIGVVWLIWQNSMNSVANSPMPKLPRTPTVVPPQMSVSQQQVKKLAREYGLTEAEIQELLNLDPTATEAELRKRIKRYLSLLKQYPALAASNPQWLLWAAGLDLSDSAIAILANLNNGKSTMYSKGQPLTDVQADILAATLADLVQKARERFSTLISQARAAKKAGIPLDEAIPGWDDLPRAVQQYLDGTSKQPYHYQYGNAIESLVLQAFAGPQYDTLRNYYENKLGLQIEKGLPGQGSLIPDVQITVNGHVDVLDITSLGNAPTKIKYNVNGVEIIIVLPYGG